MQTEPTTKTHTYSDGSQIELGSTPGKGWLETLKARHQAETPAPKRRPGRALKEALLAGPINGREF